MSNLWRSSRVLVLVVTVLVVAACGPSAQTQPTAAPAAGTGATAAPAAGGQPTAAPAAVAPPAAPGSYVEPAFFAERVKGGSLPPIEQRLPKEPFVVGPGVLIQEEYMKWENGKPGGDLKVAATFPSGLVYIGFGATILRSPSQTTGASLPNVVSEFSPSDDYKTFRFKIRDGLKWSDGMPVTTEDVRFAFEDIYGNPDVQKPFPTELYTQGNPLLDPAKLNVIDNLTFELTFSQPYGFFVAPLNSWIPGYDFMIKPAHYLKQFHKKYASEADLAAKLKENNETEWAKMLSDKDQAHWGIGTKQALGLPTLNAWVLTEYSDQRTVFERNPYYWHVDSAGNQLPYADRVVVSVVVDHPAQTNAILAGQVNIASAEDIALSEMPLYVQNAEKANIRAFTTGSFNWPVLLFLNQDFQYEDPNSTWQKLLNDPEKRFGKAIAAAINPADVDKSIYFDLFGDPVMYKDAYNPDTANQLLDQLGMQRSGNYRTGPDGKDFILRITSANQQADFVPVAELLKQQLEKVGIRVDIEAVTPDLFDQRKTSNEIMASLLWNDGPAWPSGISEDYLPNHKGPWSPATWQYVTSGGKNGRKPPANMEEFYKLHTDRKKFPPESPEGQQAFQKLMQWLENNYVMIPTAGAKVSANVVGVNLKNVPNENAPFNLDTYINAEGAWIGQ
jgi:peptide/nickel transport system substrate-binding protein